MTVKNQFKLQPFTHPVRKDGQRYRRALVENTGGETIGEIVEVSPGFFNAFDTDAKLRGMGPTPSRAAAALAAWAGRQ